MLIYNTLDSYQHPLSHFNLFAMHTLWLAEHCPSTAHADFLQTWVVTTAAGPFSCSWTTVQIFSCSLQRHLPEEHWQTAPTLWIDSKTADKFCFLFSPPNTWATSLSSKEALQKVSGTFHYGTAAKWTSKSFQQAMGMV